VTDSEKSTAASPPDIKIVPLTADHLPEVMKIETASFTDSWPVSAFRDLMIQTRTNWAALSDGAVAGYLITQWVLDEIHILNFAIAARFRRRGIAAVMLKYLIDSGIKKGSREMFLEVRASNAPAKALYEQFGFSLLSVRKKYYADGEDAMILHKRISRS
jgi:ribosomal-protein-alanine acetyltransferase